MTIYKDSIKCLPNPTEAAVIESVPLFIAKDFPYSEILLTTMNSKGITQNFLQTILI